MVRKANNENVEVIKRLGDLILHAVSFSLAFLFDFSLTARSEICRKMNKSNKAVSFVALVMFTLAKPEKIEPSRFTFQ